MILDTGSERVIPPKIDSELALEKLLVEDAISAGLEIESFSDISMLDVFQKKN